MNTAEILRLEAAISKLSPTALPPGESNVRLQELLAWVLSSTPDYVMLLSVEGEVLWANRVRQGIPVERVVGRNVFDFFSADTQGAIRETMSRVFSTGEPQAFESSIVYSDDSTHAFSSHFAPIFEQQKVVAIATIATEKTKEKQAETALLLHIEKLKVAVEATGMGLWEWDATRNAVTWDDALCRIFGIEPTNKPPDYGTYINFIHPEDRPKIAEAVSAAMENGRYPSLEHRIIRPDGAVRWLHATATVIRDSSGAPRKLIGGALDVTVQREHQERIRQAQKLEAIGQLSAGVAHNFNNMLMAVLANLDLAIGGSSHHTMDLLESAREAAREAAHLVKQLTTFAGRSRPSQKVQVSLNAMVHKIVDVCRSGFYGTDIALVAEAPSEPCLIVADRTEIEQAVLNVVMNACDAAIAARRDAPRVVVELSVVPRHSDSLVEPGGELVTDMVLLRIVDNGIGMDSATVGRMYEPFFTTKPLGRGTGLGLSTAITIFKAHRGIVDCESHLGTGTTFRIYFPRHHELIESADPEARLKTI